MGLKFHIPGFSKNCMLENIIILKNSKVLVLRTGLRVLNKKTLEHEHK